MTRKQVSGCGKGQDEVAESLRLLGGQITGELEIHGEIFAETQADAVSIRS